MFKLFILALMGLLLTSCGARQTYNKIIEDLGFIAYRTPLASVGAGTIVKGKASDLLIYSAPETCLPNHLSDGSQTQVRWVADTELPSHVREVNFKFDANLNAIGINGNPLFKFKTSATYVKSVQAKFMDAQVEFVNEFYFWQYFKSHMPEACRNAVLNYPVFWKSLKVGKMDYVFKSETGAALSLTISKIKEIIDFEPSVEWSLKDEFTLSITTPKYIGFAAAQVTDAAVESENVTFYATKLNGKGDYVWQDVLPAKSQNFLSAEKLPLWNARPIE